LPQGHLIAPEGYPVRSCRAVSRKLPLDPANAPLLGNRSCQPSLMGYLLRPENPSEPAIRDWCVKYLARTLDLSEQAIDPEAKFAQLGLDSANSVYLIVELEDWLGLELTPDLVFEHPTISKLARYLAGRAASANHTG
jgi:acyl carrier protein